MSFFSEFRQRNIVSGEQGSSLVEFAVSCSLLFMMIFGIMDFSRALYADHYVSNVAREASRYAMVRGSTWNSATCTTTTTYECSATSANVTSFVKGEIPPGFSPSAVTVTTTWPGKSPSGGSCVTTNGNNSPGCVVTVNVSYSFNFILPFLPTNALVLTSTSSVAIQE